MNDKSVRSLVKEVFDTGPLSLTVSHVNLHEIEAKNHNSRWEFCKDQFSDEDLARIRVGTAIRHASGYHIFTNEMKEHFNQFSEVTP